MSTNEATRRKNLIHHTRIVFVFVTLLIGVLLTIYSNWNGRSSSSLAFAITSTATATFSPMLRPTWPDPDHGRTAAPPSGPTMAPIIQNSLRFVDNVPETIGKWTLDRTKSYVLQYYPGGAVLFYNSPEQGDIRVLYWLIYNAQIPQYNTNNAVDRFALETWLIQVPTTKIALGDQALISPTNRKPQEKTGANPTVLAILQWRNIVIDVYATPDLLKSDFDFSDAEAIEFLTKMFDAIPKPEDAPTLTSKP
jgi:hypothetical protein